MIYQTSTRDYFVVTEGIQRGLQYRFKYRTENVNGWSEFSDIAYIYAFAVPEKPAAPVYLSGTDDSVTLKLTASRNDNGIRITSYELWIAGDETPQDEIDTSFVFR